MGMTWGASPRRQRGLTPRCGGEIARGRSWLGKRSGAPAKPGRLCRRARRPAACQRLAAVAAVGRRDGDHRWTGRSPDGRRHSMISDLDSRPGACFTSRVTSREMAFLVLSSGKAANPESIHGAHRILCRMRGSGASPLIYCRSRLLRSRIDARHAACHLVARGLRCEGRLMRGT